MPETLAFINMDDIPTGRYGVILVDPPWRFKVRSENGRGKSAEQHYKTLGLYDILRLPVREFAAPNCALFLWHTASNMRSSALPVLDRWGFEFKTMGAWVKMTKDGSRPTIGTGYVMRNAWEPFIVATVGNPKRVSRSERDVILSPRREHSRKPEEIHRKIERLYAGPYLELFARAERPGWTVWGDQIERFTPDLLNEPSAA